MKRLAIIAGVVALSGAALAPVLYDSEGFEASKFSTGSLGGQDGWDNSFAGTGFDTVVDTFSNGGTQSVLADGTVGGSNWSFVVASHDAGASSDKVVVIQWDMYIETAGAAGPSGLWGIDVYDDTVARVVALGVDDQGEVTSLDSNGADAGSGSFVNRDEWNTYAIRIDYVSHTASLWLNNAMVMDGIDTSAATDVFSDADIWVGGGLGDRAFYDNYTVNAVPEPATLAALGLGAAALLRRRRK